MYRTSRSSGLEMIRMLVVLDRREGLFESVLRLFLPFSTSRDTIVCKGARL